MSSKQKTVPNVDSPKPLKVGSRVRCTHDGVQGRITWANATAVKIQWDDGEQVTWRRDSLADRPLEILDPADDEPAPPPEQSPPAPAPQPATEPAPGEPPVVEPTLAAHAPAAEPPAGATIPPPGEPAPAAGPAPNVEQAAEDQQTQKTSGGGEAAPAAAVQAEAAEPAQEPKAKAEGKQNKRSALDAAAQVLAGAGAPMNCQELIGAMASQGLWSSPAGKTPASTLYSALLRELQQGEQARFVKVARGKFALRAPGAPQ